MRFLTYAVALAIAVPGVGVSSVHAATSKSSTKSPAGSSSSSVRSAPKAQAPRSNAAAKPAVPKVSAQAAPKPKPSAKVIVPPSKTKPAVPKKGKTTKLKRSIKTLKFYAGRSHSGDTRKVLSTKKYRRPSSSSYYALWGMPYLYLWSYWLLDDDPSTVSYLPVDDDGDDLTQGLATIMSSYPAFHELALQQR